MLSLIHNIRIDREKRSKFHSFKTNLNNFSTSELNDELENNSQMLSANWLNLYRGQ